MTQPEGFCLSWGLYKGLQASKIRCGMKQPSQSWNLHFDEAVKEFGFIKNEDEPCVYKKISGSAIVFLVLYIDDILLIGNDIPTL